jgi:hypothetical protein
MESITSGCALLGWRSGGGQEGRVDPAPAAAEAADWLCGRGAMAEMLASFGARPPPKAGRTGGGGSFELIGWRPRAELAAFTGPEM